MNSSEYKSVFASKTVWGVVLMLVGNFTGNVIPVEFAGQVADSIGGVFEVVGAGLAIFGRAKADKGLKVI